MSGLSTAMCIVVPAQGVISVKRQLVLRHRLVESPLSLGFWHAKPETRTSTPEVARPSFDHVDLFYELGQSASRVVGLIGHLVRRFSDHLPSVGARATRSTRSAHLTSLYGMVPRTRGGPHKWPWVATDTVLAGPSTWSGNQSIRMSISPQTLAIDFNIRALLQSPADTLNFRYTWLSISRIRNIYQ